MLDIQIKTIPHDQQRYDTCGDYRCPVRNKLHINVSDMNSSDSEFLVALHELIESYLVIKHGISFEAIDEFDKLNAFNLDALTEPGDYPNAPYHKEHVIATNIERLMCQILGVEWYEHNDRVNSL